MWKRIGLFLLVASLTGAVSAGTIYEWEDPETGKLKAGDKPPGGGIQYWIEGHRPPPKTETPASNAAPPSARSSAVSGMCSRLRPLARASFQAKMKGVPLSITETVAVPKNTTPEAAEILRSVVRSVYRHGATEQQADELVYQACLITYGGMK